MLAENPFLVLKIITRERYLLGVIDEEHAEEQSHESAVNGV